MTNPMRCAIYTRKSTEEGLEQDFNSLDAQQEACSAYILSQRHEGWTEVPTIYADGGYSGGNMDRPGLKALLAQIQAGKVDVIVVYKVDRLTRSLADSARIVEVLDAAGASFVSVTQAFNTTTSMGRLTLNVLLSFAQFEREVTSERIRDKIAASKQKGMWMGGPPPLGYDVADRKLVINEAEADTVRFLFNRYVELGSVPALAEELRDRGIHSKRRISRAGRATGGQPFTRGALYTILRNRLYVGEVTHRGQVFPGQHQAILSRELFERLATLLNAASTSRRTGGVAPDPSLLAGLLWDGHGRRMTPAHTRKGSLRYRYYVSRTETLDKPQPLWRVTAAEIEERVVAALAESIDSAEAAAVDASCLAPAEIESLRSITATAIAAIRNGAPRERRSTLLGLVKRTDLTTEAVTVTLKLTGLHPALGEEPIVRSSPLAAVRERRQMRLVLPPDVEASESKRSPSLIKLVAQAAHARRILESSDYHEIDSLAAAASYGREHFTDLLRIAWLAPDITAAILQGRQPQDLNRTKLIRWSGLPLDGYGQREALGFAKA